MVLGRWDGHFRTNSCCCYVPRANPAEGYPGTETPWVGYILFDASQDCGFPSSRKKSRNDSWGRREKIILHLPVLRRESSSSRAIAAENPEVAVYNLAMDEVGPRVYCCYSCRTHVSLHDNIISKAFQGRSGRAFLFSHAMNITIGPKEDRQLMTGLHTVADVFCADCQELFGWKYERAYEETQKYKEGKYILEKSKIVRDNW